MRLLKGVILIISMGFSFTAFSQTPGGINYQGVARSQYLVGLNNDSIQLRFTIKEKTANGSNVYTETRGTRTDSFGVFNVVIGAAGAIIQSGNIKKVKWSDTTMKFMMVELNILDPNTPGFLNMGTTQLLSVPFSFYSDISDSSRIANKADSAKFSNGSGKYFFSASLSPNTFQTMAGLEDFTEVVKFPLVLQNEGNVYNPITSTFTAPDSGYYQFTTSGDGWFDENSPNATEYWQIGYTLVAMKNYSLAKILNIEQHNVFVSGTGINRTEKKEDDGVKTFSKTFLLKLVKNDQVSIRINSFYVGYPGIKLGYAISPGAPFTVEPAAIAEFSGYKVK